MTRYVGLIRGLNVGTANRIKMAALKAFLEEAGLHGAETYLQSGNFVFESVKRGPDLEEQLAAECQIRLAANLMFFVRTASEWNQVVALNPFTVQAERDRSRLLVYICREPPDLAALGRIHAEVGGTEVFQEVGGNLYVHAADGVGASAFFASGKTSRLLRATTARNWNTVLALQHMLNRSS